MAQAVWLPLMAANMAHHSLMSALLGSPLREPGTNLAKIGQAFNDGRLVVACDR
jgi:hypothetical protein